MFFPLAYTGSCETNHFAVYYVSEATTKSKLASLNEKLDTLERRLELLEVQVNVMDRSLALFDLFSSEVCIRVMEKNDELLLEQEYYGLQIYDVKAKTLDAFRRFGGLEMFYANVHVETLVFLTETYGHTVNVLCSKKRD
ncbi:hypothetical protein Droror1_Dr00027494 [Drosera rotundifolia]